MGQANMKQIKWNIMQIILKLAGVSAASLGTISAFDTPALAQGNAPKQTIEGADNFYKSDTR